MNEIQCLTRSYNLANYTWFEGPHTNNKKRGWCVSKSVSRARFCFHADCRLPMDQWEQWEQWEQWKDNIAIQFSISSCENRNIT